MLGIHLPTVSRASRVIVLFSVVMLAPAGCAASGHDVGTATSSAPNSSSAPDAGPLTPAGLAARIDTAGVLRHLDDLAAVAQRNGGNRASGTAGYAATADLVANTLRGAGFRVSTPSFDYPRFTSGPVTVTADGTRVDAEVIQYSSGTRDRAVVAQPTTVVGVGCVAADFRAPVRDSIAVITRGTCTFAQKVDLAQRAGARAAIIVDTAPGSPRGMTLEPDSRPGIPVVAVGADLGERVRSAQSISIAVSAETTTVTSRNVIAETTTGAADDVVIAGAHLDSVAAGPGINDNGSGVAALLETALQLGARPPVARTVRFGFWGAEEDGLIGSTRYVASLDAAARRGIAAYLNFDMLGSPNAGYFAYDGDNSDGVGAGPGPEGSGAIEQVFLRYFAERRIPVRGHDFDGRSDYGPFVDAGIPAGGIDTGAEEDKSSDEAKLWGGTAGRPFDPNYHQRADDVGNVDVAALAITAPAVAYSVADLALHAD